MAAECIQHDLVGKSEALANVTAFIAKAAAADSTVLIHGESGTGKELVARALHRNSKRRGGPFIPVNCAALAEGLLESELFGHERGSFTGAIGRQKGKFELADGGTLFLDEIGEFNAAVQAKLLRALQERTIDRIGGASPVRIDIRLITATNRDLQSAVTAGRFREDLFYRLNVLYVRTPALRHRPEDIPELIEFFIDKFARETGTARRLISAEADLILRNYSWPGNIRQLFNVLERALILGSVPAIQSKDLPEELRESHPQTYRAHMRHAKREIFRNALARTNGDYEMAAKLLQVHPRSIHRYLRDLGLSDLLNY